MPLQAVTAGTGSPALLLIHGWTCSRSDWQWQVPVLSNDYRTITFDLPGHGGSRWPPECPVSVTHLAAQVAQLAQGLSEPSVLIGHSLGAVVALRTAVDYPDSASAIVAIEPSYGLSSREAKPAFDLVAALKSDPSSQAIADFIAKQDLPTTPHALRVRHVENANLVEPAVAAALLADLWLSAEQISLEPSTSAYIDRLTCPLLEIYSTRWPRSSESHPPAHTMTRKRVTGSGHWPHQERAADVNALILDWMHLIRRTS
jgi:pimeloyl-ACP methyl ester carboxylesterase